MDFFIYFYLKGEGIWCWGPSNQFSIEIMFRTYSHSYSGTSDMLYYFGYRVPLARGGPGAPTFWGWPVPKKGNPKKWEPKILTRGRNEKVVTQKRDPQNRYRYRYRYRYRDRYPKLKMSKPTNILMYNCKVLYSTQYSKISIILVGNSQFYRGGIILKIHIVSGTAAYNVNNSLSFWDSYINF
jgi:hypothetical protein